MAAKWSGETRFDERCFWRIMEDGGCGWKAWVLVVDRTMAKQQLARVDVDLMLMTVLVAVADLWVS